MKAHTRVRGHTVNGSECVHHFIIASPDGPISIGRCKKCHREREYENYRWPEYNVKPLSEKYKPPPKRTEDWDDD